MQTARIPQVGRFIGRKWFGLALMPLALLSGCQSAAGTGALAGGGAGALLGNGIAAATHGNRTAGTLIGGAAGAIVGTVVGDNVDRDKAKKQAAAQAQASVQAQQAGLEEIAQLTRSGVTDGIIIGKIRTSGVVYNLSAEQIVWLKSANVSDVVIGEMQATVTRVPQVVQPVYVSQPPPVGVGLGFGYTRYGR